LTQVLGGFDYWFRFHELRFVWGNSARFDLGILANGYDKAGGKAPWHYRDERCYRTINNMFHLYAEGIKSDPLQLHDPLCDCMFQIERLCKIWSFITPNRPDTAAPNYKWERPTA
jgi:hypothetical protein